MSSSPVDDVLRSPRAKDVALIGRPFFLTSTAGDDGVGGFETEPVFTECAFFVAIRGVSGAR